MNISDIFKGPAPKSLPTHTSSSSSSTPSASSDPFGSVELSNSTKRKADPSSPPQPPTFRPPKLPRTSSSPLRLPAAPDNAPFDDNQEDDDPRFFGDGLSTHDRHVLDLVDSAESAIDLTHLDAPALKHLVVRLDKSLLLNQELRARYPSEPAKFLASELDLDSDLRAVALLATAPRLYALAAQLGVPGKVVGLLAHENADIAVAVVEVLAELLDDDVVNPLSDDDDGEDGDQSAGDVLKGIRGFVDAMLAADFLSLFESAFRLAHADTDTDTSAEERDEALAKYLGLLDALLAVDVAMAARIAGESTLVEMLVELMRGGYGVVSAYAVEVVAVVVQNSRRARRKVMVEVEGGMASVLKLISAFRKRDPTDADHAEYMSNLFDILCSCLMTEPSVQRAFRDEEGFELMVMLIKARKLARTRAVRVLDYATLPIVEEDQGMEAVKNSVYFVKEAGGIGCVFALFMHGDQKKLIKAYKSDYSPLSDEEHTTSVLVNLLRALHLPAIPITLRDGAVECAARVLNKFTEDQHAKLIQLVSRFAYYLRRVGPIVAKDNEEDDEAEYLARLDRGGFTLTQLGLLLATVVRESKECGEYCARALLPAAGVGVEQVTRVVQASGGRGGDGQGDGQEDEDEEVRGLVEAVRALGQGGK